MRLRKPLIGSVFLLLFLLLYVVYAHHARTPQGMLTVAFLDVGQGDSIFIQSPTGVQVLVDGGKGNEVLRPLGSMMGFFDHDLDMVIATHPDSDHIGGLIDVLAQYTVHTIVLTENKDDSPTYDAFIQAVQNEGATVVYARKGQVYDLGSGSAGDATLSVLFPVTNTAGIESNSSSIITHLMYGARSYLLTGDAPSSIEQYLIAQGETRLASDVFKLGHHGSRTSTSDAFLDVVRPRIGIISAGKDNKYGHPHPEVLARLMAHGVPYKNTADEGSIISVTDGTEIWFR